MSFAADTEATCFSSIFRRMFVAQRQPHASLTRSYEEDSTDVRCDEKAPLDGDGDEVHLKFLYPFAPDTTTTVTVPENWLPESVL